MTDNGRWVRIAPDLIQWQEGPPEPGDDSEDYYQDLTEADLKREVREEAR